MQHYNFSVNLHGYESWSLILREEHRLKVFENRLLGRIMGPKMDEVTKVGENFITRSSLVILFVRCDENDQVKEYKISRACSTLGRKEFT
jgi:hypothetical protein